MAYRTAALVFGAFFCIAAFVLLLIAVCTNWWIRIEVDRSKLSLDNEPAGKLSYLTRNRGLFRECFANNSAAKLLVGGNRLADDMKECVRTDYDTYSQDVPYTTDNKMRIDLMIAMVVFLCFALFLCVCAFGVFCFSIFVDAEVQPRRWGLAIKWTGILLFVAAFSNAAGMAFFHGSEYLELQKVMPNSKESPYDYYFKQDQPTTLQNATTRSYSWSYALSWVAVFMEVLSALILFICGACCRPEDREKQIFEASTMNSAKSFGYRNRAYEYAEGKPPAIIYSGTPQPMNDGMYYDHFPGRHFDPYSRGQAQQEVVSPQYNFEEGGWRWQ